MSYYIDKYGYSFQKDNTGNYSLGATKKIKLKHIEEPNENIQAVDYGSTRFHIGTPVFKL